MDDAVSQNDATMTFASHAGIASLNQFLLWLFWDSQV